MSEYQTLIREDDEEPPGRSESHRTTAAFRRHYFRDVSLPQWNDWRWQITHRIKTERELSRFITLSAEEREAIRETGARLPFAVTPYYLSLVDPDSPTDPIRRTVIPTPGELAITPQESADPLHEEGDSPVPGIVHRYPDRVLFLVTPVCSTYCRYCTRSRRVGDTDLPVRTDRDAAIDYIRSHTGIRDVLLSGGDPLTMTDAALGRILGRIREIPHVEIIRIGTKVPAVLPMRVTTGLAATLKRYHPLYVSVHATHPREATREMSAACNRLANAGIPLGSQTVLLRGVNDSVETMKSLMHRLLMMRVRPYYLYQCDPIQGSSHFRTPVSTGLEIVQGLRGHTSGYAVPTYVIDAPGGGGKIPLLPDYVVARGADALVLRNYEGNIYTYPDAPGETPSRRLPHPRSMRIALLANLKENAPPADTPDRWDDLDSRVTIESILEALRAGGHDAHFLEAQIGPPHDLTRRLSDLRPDLCFNIAEGHFGIGREAQVPALLEMMRLPYTGSSVLTLALALDKPMTKRILHYHDLPTPEFQVFGSADEEINDDLVNGGDLRFPLFLKPSREGTGMGIGGRNIVTSIAELRALLAELLQRYRQPVLCERFIQGRELTVGLLGNLRPTAARRLNDRTAPNVLPSELRFFPPMEVEMSAYDPSERGVYTSRIKVELAHDFHWRCPAEIDATLERRLHLLTAAVFRVTGCHDVARVDFRLDETDGTPYILEINPLPGLNEEYSDLCIEARAAGMSYEELINGIVSAAAARCGLE